MPAPTGVPSRDAGYTLLEVMVTITIAGLLMAIAISGWMAWARSSAQEGTAVAIRSALRQAQQRAVTEGSSMCVLFDTSSDSWTLYRRACDDPTKARLSGPWDTNDSHIHLSAPVFHPVSGGTSSGVTFSSRGTASPGQVKVTRDGNDTIKVVTVEGLTGRVSTE